MHFRPISLHNFNGEQKKQRKNVAATLKPVSTIHLVLLLQLVFFSVSCNRGKAEAANAGALPPPLVSVVEASAKDV